MAANAETHWRVVRPAAWPAPPAEMTVSACAEIGECPRRWALSAAEYAELWSGRGYPPKIQFAALAGIVVHLALENVARQLVQEGVISLSHPSAPQILRKLGGYTRVVEDCIERVLKRYVDNPRAALLLERAERTLRGQVPTLRARVQSMLSRLKLAKNAAPLSGASRSRPGGAIKRSPLTNGTYTELDVRARSIGWKGKLDLLVVNEKECEIIDFKTGAPDEFHKWQLRAYAAIWCHDEELNPTRRVVDRLVLAYENQDVYVEPPSTSEIDELSCDLLARRRAAEAALAAHPPLARPSLTTCRRCTVRHLCDAYWEGDQQLVSEDGRFGDIELEITGRHGPMSWDGVVVRARDLRPKTPALLRLTQLCEFRRGTRVRVLDGAIATEAEYSSPLIIVTVGALSEVYEEES